MLKIYFYTLASAAVIATMIATLTAIKSYERQSTVGALNGLLQCRESLQRIHDASKEETQKQLILHNIMVLDAKIEKMKRELGIN